MAALSRHKGGGLGLVHLLGPGALIFQLRIFKDRKIFLSHPVEYWISLMESTHSQIS